MSDNQNELLTILLERIEQNKLVLPTLPEIALTVSDAVDNPDASLDSIADVIARDAGMSARMIHIANSALYAPRATIETLNTAVTRIGLNRIKNIAYTIAMEQLFICQNDIVFDFFDRAWGNSVEVSSAAIAALAVYKTKQPRHGLQPDILALMGLVHNIGVLPILTLADQYGDRFSNPAFLDDVTAKLSKRIGIAIVDAWGFDNQYAMVIEHWDNLDYRTEQVDYLDFIRIGAVYADLLEGDKAGLLAPAIDKGILENPEDLTEATFSEAYEQQKRAYAG